MSEQEDKQRIAALEAELTALRARSTSSDENNSASPELDNGASTSPVPSPLRMILFGIIVALLGLGIVAGIYTALSKGFDSLAQKAAATYVGTVPDGNDTNAEKPATKQTTQDTTHRQEGDALRVPGL